MKSRTIFNVRSRSTTGLIKLHRLLAVVVTSFTLVTLAWLSLVPLTQADGPDKADIIIRLGEDDVVGRQISFVAPISGLRALELTGLDVITRDMGWGIAVCSIEGIGCPGDDTCLTCDAEGKFWSYSYWDNNAWQGYMVGAADSSISNSAIEGWAWGTWPTNPPPAPPITSALKALAWLQTQQSPINGSYNDSVGNSIETMLAIGADKFNADEWRTGPISPSLLNYLQTDNDAANYAATHAGRAGKLAVALAGAGQDPQNFNGLNLVISLTNTYSETTGTFNDAPMNQAWAILGWRAAGQTVPLTATHHLAARALSNGGWEWGAGFGSDTNTTALALQALVAGGECLTSPNIINGLDYLKTAQNNDGGFTYDPQSVWGTDSDTNSTAWVLQALHILGEDSTGSEWTINSTNPISYLLSMQLPDGSFEWQTGYGTNQLATQQAIVPLLGQSFPLHMALLDQSQCFVSPRDYQYWLPVIIKSTVN